jgi:hypothetical protein
MSTTKPMWHAGSSLIAAEDLHGVVSNCDRALVNIWRAGDAADQLASTVNSDSRPGR